MTQQANTAGALILRQGRLVLALVAVFALAGIAAYFQMSRQEDPSFPYRAAIITVNLPGAGPERMERLIARPLERELAEVSQVIKIDTVLRQGVGIFTVQLGDSVYDTAAAWDRVRVAMDKAARDYPDGVQQSQLDDRIIDASLMVVALTDDSGQTSLRALADDAKALQRHLLSINGVASTELWGDPGQQITIAIDDAAMSRNGLSPSAIAADVGAHNKVTRGGTIELSGASMNLDPDTDFQNLEQIRNTAIGLPSGQTLPLSALAHVYESNASPGQAQLWYNGERAVGLEIVAQRGVNTVKIGQQVRAAIQDFSDTLAPVQQHEMFYQPQQTQDRLHNLSMNLLVSVLIILAVLFVFMGIRMGLVVALLLPLVTLTTLTLYTLGGGILQQIAVIGLVVSLGILVDNAIVMSENVQWRLNAGQSRNEAAAGSIGDLAGPLLAATGTTLAAFVPMLLSNGNTADFTRALPVMIMIALSVSYLFAISVTPLICRRYLRPQVEQRRDRLDRVGDALARLTTRSPWWLIGGGALAILLVAACTPLLDQEFFPAADRDVVVADLSLPEGTAIAHTAQITRRLESELRTRAGVDAIHAFIGNGGPTFYYNLRRAPAAPQFARLVIKTNDTHYNTQLIDFVEQFSRDHLPGADVIARPLGQGPIINAPIELRVFNPDAQQRVKATETIFAAIQSVSGTRDVRNDLGTGVPGIHYHIHNAIARSFGVTPLDVADTLAGRSNGLVVGEYRGEQDPMPIKLRSPAGEHYSPVALSTANVYGTQGQSVPLMQVATPELTLEPGAIRHYNQRRVSHVYSELQHDVAYSQVLNPLRGKIEQLKLPAGTHIEYGGNNEESSKANNSLFRAAPLGLALLLFFLLVQFNSFTRVLLVLLTAPFALAGVIPGLLLLGIPFGFMPLLGVIALTGIVVNNAIVLIDVIDQCLAEGQTISDAVAEAVRRRARPIVLTTATTVAGLLPLALSDTTLWPPMAWPIITGLLASTVLTLLVLPSVCRVTLARSHTGTSTQNTLSIAVTLTVLAAALIVAPTSVRAQDTTALSVNSAQQTPPRVTLGQALRSAGQRAQVQRNQHELEATRADADRVRRAGRYPTLSASAFANRSDDVANLNTRSFTSDVDGLAALPNQRFPLGDRNQQGATVELRQPVVDIAQQLYGAPAAASQVDAARSTLNRARIQAMVAAGQAYLDSLSVKARLQANAALINDLTSRADRIESQREVGRALKSDVLEIRYNLAKAEQEQQALKRNDRLAEARLGQTMGRGEGASPTGLPQIPDMTAGPATQLTQQALAQRQDLAAMDEQIRAAALQIKAISAQRLPTIDAVASLRYNNGNVFVPDHQKQIGAQLTWRPFAGGQISAQKRAASARLAGLRAARAELVRDIGVSIRQANARLENVREQRRLTQLGVESAQASRDTRSARLNVGRANLSDVLESDTQLADRRAQVRSTEYDELAAWLQLQGVLGNESALRQLAY